VSTNEVSLPWLFVFIPLAYVLYLSIGWTVLNDWCRYSIESLRRELALNGVGGSSGDPDFRFSLGFMYYALLAAWPFAVYRKVRTGRVVGRDFREEK
jgi:hypothetical protein